MACVRSCTAFEAIKCHLCHGLPRQTKHNASTSIGWTLVRFLPTPRTNRITRACLEVRQAFTQVDCNCHLETVHGEKNTHIFNNDGFLLNTNRGNITWKLWSFPRFPVPTAELPPCVKRLAYSCPPARLPGAPSASRSKLESRSRNSV